MASFFARYGLGKFSKIFDDIGVESPEDLKLIEADDLTEEGMEQAAAEHLVNRIQQIIHKENIASGEETEEDHEKYKHFFFYFRSRLVLFLPILE